MKKTITLLLALAMLLSLSSFAWAQEVENEILWDENEETILLENSGEYGAGETSFYLVVSCLNETTAVMVNTDEQTVGAALEALSIVAGEESEWGLYVKTVNGITADYDTDGSYWAFYIDGEYAMTGLDATEINPGSVYMLAVEGIELEEGQTITLRDGKNYGLGEKSFAFQVTDKEENTISVTVCTNAETVGEALSELSIIAGDESEFGLYVKTINGITADYDVDGSYWAFYIDGEYAMTGVDATEINPESVYLLTVEGIELEEGQTITLRDGKNYGLGEKVFGLKVTDKEGNETFVTVCTDAATVGEALLQLNIIAGDESEWGLYVKTINGITADYNVDGTYWAFYIDGEYAMTGVDATEIQEEAVYSFAVEG